MFRFIELFGMLILLWFVANFVHYIVWTASGYEGPSNILFGMSSGWIKNAKEMQEESKQSTKPATKKGN